MRLSEELLLINYTFVDLPVELIYLFFCFLEGFLVIFPQLVFSFVHSLLVLILHLSLDVSLFI